MVRSLRKEDCTMNQLYRIQSDFKGHSKSFQTFNLHFKKCLRLKKAENEKMEGKYSFTNRMGLYIL